MSLFLSFACSLVVAHAHEFRWIKPRVMPNAAAARQMLAYHGQGIVFVGHDAGDQYADPKRVMEHLDDQVGRLDLLYGRGKWVAVFDGAPVQSDVFDLAHLMRHLTMEHDVRTLAVRSDETSAWGVDDHLTYALFVPTTRTPRLDHAGRSVLEHGEPVREAVRGGLHQGEPVGPTAFYLGREVLDRKLIREVVALGGGDAALDEARYAYHSGLPVMYLRARALKSRASDFGPIDAWAQIVGGAWDDRACEKLFLVPNARTRTAR